MWNARRAADVEAAFATLMQFLRYVDGDYQDPVTFAIRKSSLRLCGYYRRLTTRTWDALDWGGVIHEDG